MRLVKQPHAVKTFKVFMIILSIFLLVHLTLQYINTVHVNQTYGPFYELTNRLDFDDEMSIPTWYSQFLFLLIGGVAFLLAYIEKQSKSRIIWVILGLAALVGSIDEVSAVHESVLQVIHLLLFDEGVTTLTGNAWLVVLPIVLVAVGWFLKKAYQVLPTELIVLLASAMGLYLFGAVVVDMVSSAIIESSPFVNQGVLVALEEGLELLGLSVVLCSLIAYAEREHGTHIALAVRTLQKTK